MGITIESANKSIDLRNVGFKFLREKIAELINTEISEHYKLCYQAPYGSERDEFFKQYDIKTAEI